MNETYYCDKCKALRALEQTINLFEQGQIIKEDIPENIPENIRKGLIKLLEK